MSRQASPPALRAYVGAWALAALLSVGPGLWGLETDTRTLQWVAVLTVIVALAERTELYFRFRGLTTSFTLIEAAVAGTLLLLPGTHAIITILVGAGLASLARARQPIKVVFNAAQIGVSAWVATLALAVLPDIGPMVGLHSIGALVVAMLCYGAVNLAAVALLAIPLDGDMRDMVGTHGWLTAFSMVSGPPLGIIGAELAVTRPELVWLLIVPTAAVHLAYRGTARTQDLLGQVRREAERLNRIVAGTSDGILLLSADGTIEVWNDALARLTGVPADGAVGQPISRIMTGVRLGPAITGRWLMADADAGAPSFVEQSAIRHLTDGTIRTVRESHTFLFEGRRCVGDVVVVADITREHEVNELKNDFLSRVSHELRTPLTPIKGFAAMLLTRADVMSEEQRRTALERIVDRADRMAEMVDDILLVTEYDGQKAGLTLEAAPTSPVRAVEGVELLGVAAAMADTLAHETGREVRVVRDGKVHARADLDRLSQVLRHLLDNAVRYSPADTHVEVRGRFDDRHAYLDIVDQGRGIASSDQERIFEPFMRLEDPLRMTTSGVGIGLYIVRRLVREMDGDVTVRSRPGEGSTFTLQLPLSQAPSPRVEGELLPSGTSRKD